MKDATCARCRRPKSVVMKLACTCSRKCDHPYCNSNEGLCVCIVRERGLPCTRPARHGGVCVDRTGWRDRPAVGHDQE